MEHRDCLAKLQNAGLKPKQKVFLLKNYIIPKYTYWLKHERLGIGALRAVDRMTRAAVRKILHLPHDVPAPFFHKKPWEGGLGLMELEVAIVEQLSGTKEKLTLQREIWAQVAKTIDVPLSRRIRRTKIADFVDGQGPLEERRPGCYGWITNGTRMMRRQVNRGGKDTP